MNKTIVEKETLVKIVRSLAEINGFKIREDIKTDFFPYIEDDDVNFTFRHNFNYEEYKKTGVALNYYFLNISVKRMGGQPTVEDLRQTAAKINNAASFMEVFNSKNYAVEEK